MTVTAPRCELGASKVFIYETKDLGTFERIDRVIDETALEGRGEAPCERVKGHCDDYFKRKSGGGAAESTFDQLAGYGKTPCNSFGF